MPHLKPIMMTLIILALMNCISIVLEEASYERFSEGHKKITSTLDFMTWKS